MDAGVAPGVTRQRLDLHLRAPGPRFRPVVPAGTVTCPACHRRAVSDRYERSLRVCTSCDHHGPVGAAARALQLADPESLEVIAIRTGDRDPLEFDDGTPYRDRVAQARAKTGLDEVFLVARALLGDLEVILACMDFGFLGGSLGSGAGECFAQACEFAVAEDRALIATCTSGGARMQEGIASLAQMARCSAGVAVVAAAGLPYISILTDPCFGGVTASFAVQADVLLAEPRARIGFAGGRVIEQAGHDRLPDGFQSAEFLLEHGMLDAVVDRRQLRRVIAGLLTAYSSHRR